jgi:uncharacterized tellurite resistance protein B-like protein
LNANEEEKEKIRRELRQIISEEKTIPVRLFGIDCLIKDGIHTWEDILRLKKQSEETMPESPAEPEKPDQADTAELNIAELATRVVSNIQDTAEASRKLIEQLLRDNDLLQRQIELLDKENRGLKDRVDELLRHLAQAQSQTDDWHNYAAELAELLDITRSQKLIELAEAVCAGSERGREVLLAIQRFTEEQKQKLKEGKRQELIRSFPSIVTAGQYTNTGLAYTDRFLDKFLELQNGERTAVREALEKFATLGREYSSLKTRPIVSDSVENAPPGSFLVNASDVLRLIWNQVENTIHFSNIGHKGEKWLHSSEA